MTKQSIHEQVLDVVCSWPGVTSREVAEELYASINTVRESLQRHKTDGAVRVKKPTVTSAMWYPRRSR